VKPKQCSERCLAPGSGAGRATSSGPAAASSAGLVGCPRPPASLPPARASLPRCVLLQNPQQGPGRALARLRFALRRALPEAHGVFQQRSQQAPRQLLPWAGLTLHALRGVERRVRMDAHVCWEREGKAVPRPLAAPCRYRCTNYQYGLDFLFFFCPKDFNQRHLLQPATPEFAAPTGRAALTLYAGFYF